MKRRLTLLFTVIWMTCAATLANDISVNRALQIAAQITENTSAISANASPSRNRDELSLA